MISLDSYEDDACKSGVFAVNSKVKILLKNSEKLERVAWKHVRL